MRLPRRVPWASVAELDQLSTWIYANENDVDAIHLAINRLSAWRAITHLPHALESTLSLLVAILNDRSNSLKHSHLAVRQCYAVAIIRLVNGLVDPLQQGTYARSIASIATQLGLPLWLVELRHSSTHEDLPSLEVLREAAEQSLAWLLHNYFIPTINPPAGPSNTQTPLRPLAPILKQYKLLLKGTLRDTTLIPQYDSEITATTREVERWISECMVTSNIAMNGLEWDGDLHTQQLDNEDDADPQEQWALESLCDELLKEGILVPLSKKKRVFDQQGFQPPRFSLDLWSPLLLTVHPRHPTFPNVLFNSILNQLLPPPEEVTSQDDKRQKDSSYLQILARWAFWIIEKEWNSDIDVRHDSVVSLITSLGPTRPAKAQGEKAAQALLDAVRERFPEFRGSLIALSVSSTFSTSQSWELNDLALMNQRLEAVIGMTVDPILPESHPSVEQPSSAHEKHHDDKLPTGWKLLGAQSWKPCPIGVRTSA